MIVKDLTNTLVDSHLMEDLACQLQFMTNQPYDETVVVKDSEEVPSLYFPAPQQTILMNRSAQQQHHMVNNNSYVLKEAPSIKQHKVKDLQRPHLHEPDKSNEEEEEVEDDDSHDDNSDDDDDDDNDDDDDDDDDDDEVNDVPNDEEEEKEDDDDDEDDDNGDDDVPNDEEEDDDEDDEKEDEDDDDDSDEIESDEVDDERYNVVVLNEINVIFDEKFTDEQVSFENLPISSNVEKLFHFITGYTPQTVELNYKLIPFIPDFIPAVGDTDAFLKVPRPDGKADGLGLLVLDEPFPKQSDPTMLSMWFSENSKQHNVAVNMKVKSIENPQKNQKDIKNWIESIGELHRSKPAATVHYTSPMPDIEDLMQEWPPEFEELLGKVKLPPAVINCDVAEYLELICTILDIPVFENRIQSLHVLLTLYTEFKNSQHFKAKEEKETG